MQTIIREEGESGGGLMSGHDPFRPMYIVQGTYAIHPRSNKLLPYDGGRSIHMPREIFSQIS